MRDTHRQSPATQAHHHVAAAAAGGASSPRRSACSRSRYSLISSGAMPSKASPAGASLATIACVCAHSAVQERKTRRAAHAPQSRLASAPRTGRPRRPQSCRRAARRSPGSASNDVSGVCTKAGTPRTRAWAAGKHVRAARTLDLTSVGFGLRFAADGGGGASPCHLPVVTLL